VETTKRVTGRLTIITPAREPAHMSERVLERGWREGDRGAGDLM